MNNENASIANGQTRNEAYLEAAAGIVRNA